MKFRVHSLIKSVISFVTATMFVVPGAYASEASPDQSGILIASNTGIIAPLLRGGIDKGDLNTLDIFQSMVLSDPGFPALIKVHLPRVMHVYNDSVKRKLVWQELIYTEFALVDSYQIERFERVAAACNIRL